MNELASNASDGWESIAGIYAFSEGSPAIEHLDGISSKHDLTYFSTRTIGPRVHEIFGNMASAELACRATLSINPNHEQPLFLVESHTRYRQREQCVYPDMVPLEYAKVSLDNDPTIESINAHAI